MDPADRVDEFIGWLMFGTVVVGLYFFAVTVAPDEAPQGAPLGLALFLVFFAARTIVRYGRWLLLLVRGARQPGVGTDREAVRHE